MSETVPASVELAINIAWNELRSAADHNLRFASRRWLWRALGPLKSSVSEVGWRRRTDLAFRCAQRTLPLWKDAFESDPAADEALLYVKSLMTGPVDKKSVLARYETYDRHFKRLLGDGPLEKTAGALAGLSAANAVLQVVRDEVFESYSDADMIDHDLDPDDYDAVIFSAAAWSNGAPWDDGSDPLRRKEYWHWWLFDAYPRTWTDTPMWDR